MMLLLGCSISKVTLCILVSVFTCFILVIPDSHEQTDRPIDVHFVGQIIGKRRFRTGNLQHQYFTFTYIFLQLILKRYNTGLICYHLWLSRSSLLMNISIGIRRGLSPMTPVITESIHQSGMFTKSGQMIPLNSLNTRRLGVVWRIHTHHYHVIQRPSGGLA